MIICSCNAIREEEIRGMARCGHACPVAAYAALGCNPQCGCCLDYAQEIIDEEHEALNPVARAA
ncbi:(2Fe-2S)-binding protein [Sphingomonas lacunae]|uniref:(2Fe-2S)-binding protein n=1 Tax=Sphingomonas lacunae TaxID=2698828 RepID=A0A6M4AW68_9SPHN|nr:(2Fe-2S)-binding protein [Sphingomonas lacunae]QJQ31221.1 (2Fe-2S)-binding protein [Sphingomonas lacunae]